MEISLNGTTMIGGVKKYENGEKVIGLMIAKTNKTRPVDTTDPEWPEGKKITPDDDTLVVWLPSLQGARVLQDRVNILTLELNGYNIAK